MKDTTAILNKLGIEQLNPMQLEAIDAIEKHAEVLLLSPTGTGKTLAFLLPLIERLDPDLEEIQLLIVVPTRELAIQINTVLREMGTGHKTNTVYGGSLFSKDKTRLKHRPAILAGTPGRIADHIQRHTFPTEFIHSLVLDEFDKSLEVGFEKEMKAIIQSLDNLERKVLTSATQRLEIPDFVRFRQPLTIDYLDEAIETLRLRKVTAKTNNKLEALAELLEQLGSETGIVFCNFKETISEVSDFLWARKIRHGDFYGGMEQKDRERALIKFRNGTHRVLIATDLASRGIDVPEIGYIIHFQLPNKPELFIHRNGRTARMNREGTAYVLLAKGEQLPEFVGAPEEAEWKKTSKTKVPEWQTLFISGGRQDKISKGDIAGLFLKQGKLKSHQLGMIELKVDCAFAAVEAAAVASVLPLVNNQKLKTKKVRISLI